MTALEEAALDRLLRAALTPSGYERARATIHHDEALKHQTPNEPLGSDQYFLAIYGDPSAAGEWGWRLEGHHLSVRQFFKGDAIAVSPIALGFQQVGGQPEDILRGRESALIAFLESLTSDQIGRAREGAPALRSQPLSESSQALFRPQGGLSNKELSMGQKELLLRVVADYFGDVRGSPAPSELHLDSAALLFAGSALAGEPKYFRLTTPSHLIEYQDLGHHIHSAWRSSNDFGRASAP